MTYHSYNIAYGGDKSVNNLEGWVNNWVTLLTAVLKSDVCKVSRALLQSVASLLHLSAEPGSAAQAHWLWAAWGCVLHACTVAD